MVIGIHLTVNTVSRRIDSWWTQFHVMTRGKLFIHIANCCSVQVSAQDELV